MAELDFSHHVSEIPAGARLPESYQGHEKVNITAFPDMQGAINNYAEANNWMSSIGAHVASVASNEVALRIGGELGKNPRGDIGIPLTEFDKTMQNSYKEQAQATLGLQAQKLIQDSNTEIAKAPRITPDLIAKSNQNISLGLKNILQHAPYEVKNNLENHYAGIQINQTAELTRRMIGEQKEDMRHNTAMATQLNTQHAYSFGFNGNEKEALSVIESTRKLNESAVAQRLITPEVAKQNIDAAKKAYLNGHLIHQYEAFKAEGKGEEFLKDLADGKLIKVDDPDYMSVTNNLMGYVNHQDALRSQDQQLRLTKFQTSVAMDPMAPDMASQLQDLKENVKPEAYEKAQLHYINAVKTYTKQQGDLTNALTSWGDPASFARLTDKSVNHGFDMLVTNNMQQHEKQGNPISQEESEIQVAASAGGKIPVFVDSIKNKINSGNPAMMDTAARQMDALYSMNAGHALQGLSDSDKSIFTQFKSLRDSLPPEEAAKIAIQNANQDPDTQKMNKEKWASFVKISTGSSFGATPPQDWALRQVDLDKDEFMNPGIANEYGNLVLNKYATFFQNMNGDKENALKLTKQEVKQNFGYTGVNGGKVKTLHPIEKVLGYEENSDVVPYIQNDVMDNLNKSFMPLKEAFQKNESNEYWDIVPNEHKNQNLIFGHNYPPIQVKRYTRTASGVKSDTYDVMLIGNSFNWDIALQTDSGIRPLVQVAPYLGIQTYEPNKKAIDNAYMNRGRSQ